MHKVEFMLLMVWNEKYYEHLFTCSNHTLLELKTRNPAAHSAIVVGIQMKMNKQPCSLNTIDATIYI